MDVGAPWGWIEQVLLGVFRAGQIVACLREDDGGFPDTVDILEEFTGRVDREINILKILQRHGKISVRQIVLMGKMEDRLAALERNSRYREDYIKRLCSWGGMSIGVPSRYTEMTPEKERAGWEITHQGWDEAFWLAGCADEAEL